MKLLLDEMHAPSVAAQLRVRGHDVIAVAERAELVGLSDREILDAATVERRALVTENVKDFAGLNRTMTNEDKHHAGMVFTHPRRFPRHARGHIGILIDALAQFLEATASTVGSSDSFIWWLELPDPAGPQT